jgi:hypothetical protein
MDRAVRSSESNPANAIKEFPLVVVEDRQEFFQRNLALADDDNVGSCPEILLGIGAGFRAAGDLSSSPPASPSSESEGHCLGS